jgi:dTDP-4-amino-4,6-dideoxygalactose transaminase
MSDIPLVDLKAQYASIRDEIDDAIARVVGRQQFLNGPETAAFEAEFAAFSGIEHVVAVSSGTTALELVLAALGVGPGDEIVTVSFTFFATVEAIVKTGATPVLVDVTPEDWTLDPAGLAAAVTPRTKAILPVHLYGHPADLDAIAAAAPGVPIVEDAAQAHGARHRGRPVGSTTTAATFSFFPGKNLGAYGDAGAIATGDGELAARLRSLRDHGRSGKYEHAVAGTNARAAELQAAVLRAKLPHLAAWNEERRRLSIRYEDLLPSVRRQEIRPWATTARHLFVVSLPRREAAAAALTADGIASGVHYPIPCHLQPAAATFAWRAPGDLAVTAEAASTVLSLPLYPELGDAGVERVATSLQRALSEPVSV